MGKQVKFTRSLYGTKRRGSGLIKLNDGKGDKSGESEERKEPLTERRERGQKGINKTD